MEQGLLKALEEAEESVRWYQHVQGAADNNCAERPRANVRGWSPEWERIDSRDQYSSSRGDTDSPYDRYRGNFRAGQLYSEDTRSHPVRKISITVSGTVWITTM